MKKIFQQLKNQFSASTKISHSKAILGNENQNPKVKTEYNANSALLMAFDFMAYFDDRELENYVEEISDESPAIDTNTEFFCKNDEKCNEILCSPNSQQFECCIN